MGIGSAVAPCLHIDTDCICFFNPFFRTERKSVQASLTLKVVEFDHFKSEAGLHTFTLSAKEWIEKTNAVGIYVQAGRYGGTYAHKDIAFEFGSAISPIFKLYLLKEYQRLKDAENDRLKLEWSAKRFLSKNNYLIHTDAVKNYVLPQSNYTKNTEWLAYADEADLLNVALFGCTAKA